MPTNSFPNNADSSNIFEQLTEILDESAQQEKRASQTIDVSAEVSNDAGVPAQSLSLSTGSDGDKHLLQELLADLVFGSGRQPDFTPLEAKIRDIEHQLHDPEEIIQLLLPVISEILNRKILESRGEIIRAIVPIIDQVIVEKTQEDKVAMIRAIANLIPGAIEQQVRNTPEDLIEALAPAMGEIIKQQIRIERDAMVDALYPVIGMTISKYMGEVVQEINQRVEGAITPAGIRRKIRAKMKGISEAELILQESMPFEVKAVFLIHKQSGLIISSAHREEESAELESDLMAGMLTAMRSFASECVLDSGNASELKEIEYESFQIIMEVAGYCYLASVIKGETERGYTQQIRRSLTQIILRYDRDRSIHDYSGDPVSINGAVHRELYGLVHYQPEVTKQEQKPPVAFFLLLLLPLVLWGGVHFFRQRQAGFFAAVAAQINTELDVDPQLAVYPIQSEVRKVDGDRQIHLTGKIPSVQLRDKAETIAAQTVQTFEEPQSWQIVNDIIAVDAPPDPEAIAAEIERLTTVFNQDKDIVMNATYDGSDKQVTITGHFRTEAKLKQATESFSRIPGVENILVPSLSKAFPIDQQLYFAQGSAALNPTDKDTKLQSIQDFLQQYPQIKLRITGYTYPNEVADNQRLAQQRAEAVRESLISAGANPDNLVAQGAPSSPPNLTQADDPWLSRSVRFERIMEQ
ncbi:MAG: OmpA family protein [Limnothrix sp. RL_2_0]|nr:OmpA family protein [Limnothrix sp. RL_2_0]